MSEESPLTGKTKNDWKYLKKRERKSELVTTDNLYRSTASEHLMPDFTGPRAHNDQLNPPKEKSMNSGKYESTECYYIGRRKMGVCDTYKLKENVNSPHFRWTFVTISVNRRGTAWKGGRWRVKNNVLIMFRLFFDKMSKKYLKGFSQLKVSKILKDDSGTSEIFKKVTKEKQCVSFWCHADCSSRQLSNTWRSCVTNETLYNKNWRYEKNKILFQLNGLIHFMQQNELKPLSWDRGSYIRSSSPCPLAFDCNQCRRNWVKRVLDELSTCQQSALMHVWLVLDQYFLTI